MKKPLLHSPHRIVFIIFWVTSVAVGLILSSCQGGWVNSSSTTFQPVTVGMEKSAVNTLIFLAIDQGYFRANGLEVTVKEYGSGLAAVNAMLNNEVDFASSSEYVLVGKALAGEKIRAVASIDKFYHIKLIARTDRGIESIADLKGKRVGLPLKTASEFFFGRFLELNGIQKDQIFLVNLSPDQLAAALAEGDVDAIIAWPPHTYQTQALMQDRLKSWPVQNEQASYCNLTVRQDYLADHPETVKAFLKALAQAEAFLGDNPDKARDQIQKRLGYDSERITATWPEHQFNLIIEQSLILAMEDEARWMIANELAAAGEPPNFLDHLYLDGLKSVKPDGVNIIE